MIDIHIHILPGLDDGSPDMATSIKYLEAIIQSGVTDIIATPHYIVGEYDNDNTIIETSCKKLIKEAKSLNLSIKIHTGVELYLTGNIDGQINLDNYCLGNSHYILVESALNGLPANLFEILYRIVKKGYKPILAHPERYSDIIDDHRVAEDLVYRDVYLQANAGSFLGKYGESVAKTVWCLLEKGLIHFIASDCHCASDEYSLLQTKDMLIKHYPNYPIELLTDINPRKVIDNKEIQIINSQIYVDRQREDTLLTKIKRFLT